MKDLSILRMVAGGLIFVLLAIVVGVFLLLMQDKNVPNEVWAVGFSIVTGLLGLLAPSRTAAAGE
jgi:hypothetical protein